MVKKKTDINVGFGITPPKEKCEDSHCPFHGKLSLRGRTFTGLIIAARAPRMATVEWGRRRYVQKFERYEKRRTRLQAHNPPCVGATTGDIVRIMECKPISKTKNFVIVEKLGKETLIQEMLEKRERVEDKKKEEKKRKQAEKAAESEESAAEEKKYDKKESSEKKYDKEESSEEVFSADDE